LKLEKCSALKALRSELQIVTDRINSTEIQQDDKKYSIVLQLEISQKNLQNITFEASIAKREYNLTKKVAKFEGYTKGMGEVEVERYVDRLRRDVEKFNDDIKEENAKRSAQIEIVKKDYITKSCKEYEKKLREAEEKTMEQQDIIDGYEEGIVQADEGKSYVEIPFVSSGTGIVEKNRSRYESLSAQPQTLVNAVKQLTIEEFEEYHRKISADMAFMLYKGDITMADIEFYTYDRYLVFEQIFERAKINGIIPDIKDKTFGKDVNDIVFIWLVRGTNLDRIKVGLNPTIQERIDQLVRRYSFTKREIDRETGSLKKLKNNELTVSRFCDVYPMKVWAMWNHPTKSERPDFVTFTDLSKEEKDLIRLFRCPSLPYLCSKTNPDGSKNSSDFNGILLVHVIVLTDFDRLMYEWVRNNPNMPDEYVPRVDLIKKIIKHKITARRLVPKDDAKYEELSKTNLITGTNPQDMKENIDTLNGVKEVLKKMLKSILDGEMTSRVTVIDLLKTLNEKDKLPEIEF